MPRSKTGVKRDPPDPEKLKSAIQLIKEKKLTLYSAAKHTGLARSTIRRYMQNFKDTGKENYNLVQNCSTKKVFNREEENMLVEYIKDAATLQYGLTLRTVRELAYQFAASNNKSYPAQWDQDKMAGEFWLRLFRKRYKNDLALRKPEATSLARSTAFNRTNVTLTFNNYKAALEKCPPLPAVNIWNCDETGLSTVHVPPKILATKGSKQVGSMTSAERGTNITMISAVNAGGGFAPPMLIFPRVNFKDFMLTGAPPGTIGGANPSGWSNETLFIQFFKHFLQYAKPSKDLPCIMLMDNHESHISVPVIQLAKDNGVILVTFHPHTSHKMQPLDRTVFGAFKTYFNTAMNEHMISPGNIGKPVSIYDLAQLVGKAFPLAFTPSNITQGFKVTGFVPLNENIFQDFEFSPSNVTDRPDPAAPEDNIVISNQQLTNNVPLTSNCLASTQAITNIGDVQAEPLPSTSSAFISPSMIRPHPKAAPRKNTRKGRRKGRSRILTDTPEKLIIEEQKPVKARKVTVSAKLKKTKCNPKQLVNVKRKVLADPDSSSETSTSEDFSLQDSNDSDSSLHFSDLDVGMKLNNNIETSSPEASEISYPSPRYAVGDFVIVVYEAKFFPGKILETTTEGAVVSAMQKTFNFWKWPERIDSMFYLWDDILKHISPPKKSHSKRDIYEVKEMCNINEN